MDSVLLNLIAEIRTELEEYGDKMEPPTPANRLAALCETTQQRFAYALPTAYVAVLERHDGISCNGIQLYASQDKIQITSEGRSRYLFGGLVEANELWREFEPNRDFVFFAESGDRLYCHNLLNNRFEIVDRITKELDDPTDSLATCEQLLECVFNHML
ncbi:MAG TPA: YrhA family protein, partial [Hymenobacter sp.]